MCTNLQLKKLTSDMVQEYRRVYGKDIETILLFGSYARGDQGTDSDVDIVAIVHGERMDLQERLKEIWDVSVDIGLENDVVVSATVIPFDEFEMFKRILPYYINIVKEGVEIGWVG